MPSCVIYPIYSTTEGFATPILPRGSHRRPTWPPHPFSSARSVGVRVSALYHQVDGAYTPLTTPRNQPHLNLMSLLGRVLVAVTPVPTCTGAKPDIDCYLALGTNFQSRAVPRFCYMLCTPSALAHRRKDGRARTADSFWVAATSASNANCEMRMSRTLLAPIPKRARRSWDNPARQKNRNNSHELRDFIVLPSSVWASHRNELRQEQAACKQAALARAPGDDTKSVLGIRFRTTRRSRGGAARGAGTPCATSKAGRSAAWSGRTSARINRSVKE